MGWPQVPVVGVTATQPGSSTDLTARNSTSALPPKADSSRTSGHVRFVPIADLTSNGEIDLPARPQFMRQQAVIDKLIGRRRHRDLAPETHDGSIPVFQFAHLCVCNVAL